MGAHLTIEMVERYKLRRMTPSELLDTDDHVSTCEACRELLFFADGLSDATSLLRSELNSLPEVIPTHLGFQVFTQYVDRRLDDADLEIVQEHLNSCEHCAADMRDLLTYNRELDQAARQ